MSSTRESLLFTARKLRDQLIPTRDRELDNERQLIAWESMLHDLLPNFQRCESPSSGNGLVRFPLDGCDGPDLRTADDISEWCLLLASKENDKIEDACVLHLITDVALVSTPDGVLVQPPRNAPDKPEPFTCTQPSKLLAAIQKKFVSALWKDPYVGAWQFVDSLWNTVIIPTLANKSVDSPVEDATHEETKGNDTNSLTMPKELVLSDHPTAAELAAERRAKAAAEYILKRLKAEPATLDRVRQHLITQHLGQPALRGFPTYQIEACLKEINVGQLHADRRDRLFPRCIETQLNMQDELRQELTNLLLPRGMCFFAALRSPQDSGDMDPINKDIDIIKDFLRDAVDYSILVPVSSQATGASTFSEQSASVITKVINVVNVPQKSDVVVYYAGHDHINQFGDWRVCDGVVTFDDYFSWWTKNPGAKENHLLLICDCCNSNKWVLKLRDRPDLHEYPICIQGASSNEAQANVLAPLVCGYDLSPPQGMDPTFFATPVYKGEHRPLSVVSRVGSGAVFTLPPRAGTPEKPQEIIDLIRRNLVRSCKDNGDRPLGFDDDATLYTFSSAIQNCFSYPVDICFHGSAVNGYSWVPKASGEKRLFDGRAAENDPSDYDVMLISPTLADKVKQDLRDHKTPVSLDANGVARVRGRYQEIPVLTKALRDAKQASPHGRPVAFVVSATPDKATSHTGAAVIVYPNQQLHKLTGHLWRPEDKRKKNEPSNE